MNTYSPYNNLQESLQTFDNEKRRWENAINCYRGPDPLGLWWNYICWLEQNIHIDTENQFRKSLEHCLSIYEHFDGYKQDVRMVKLWIKYIDMQPSPPQMYQMLYQRGVGTQLAAFYIGWAHYFDSAGAFKQAESIFNLALQTNAHPMEELRAAQNKFRMSVAQRMLYDDGSSKKRSANNLAEQRQQITQLNPSSSNSSGSSSSTNNSSVKRSRTQETESAQPAPTSNNSYFQSTQQQQQQQYNAENVQTSAYQHPQNSSPAYDYTPPTLDNSATVISSSLNFVYDETKTEDNEEMNCNAVYDYESGIQLPQNHVKYSKNSLQMWRVPLFLDEPFESKKVHYPKHAVYPGDGTEYSLEEIRARRWYRRLEEIKERKRVLHQKQEEERMKMQQERQKMMQKQKDEDQKRQMEEERRQQEIADQERQRQTYLQSQQQYMNRQESFAQNNFPNKSTTASDDIEDQIEASTISFSSGENGANKRITIKFKKERTVETHEIPAIPAPPITPAKVPSAKKKRVKYSILSSYDNNQSSDKTLTPYNGHSRRQVDDANLLLSFSSNNDDSSSYTLMSSNATATRVENNGAIPEFLNNDDSYSNSEFSNSLSGENSNQGSYNFNGFCSTPIRNHSVASSKTSTPISTNRLKGRGTNMSYLNDDSLSSEQNKAFFEEDEETKRRRLEKAIQTIDTHLARKSIDPFSNELCKAFLTKLDFPNRDTTENCVILRSYFPRFSKGQDVTLGDCEYYVDKEVGRGAYGAVFRAIKSDTKEIMALKYQKPANSWEFYVCQEVRKRCKNTDMLPGFMHITTAVIAPNCTVFVSEFSNYGSLLDINNRIRTATTKVMHESLVMHFSSQILNIVQHLHRCNIVHADIKPDNFLLMKTPNMDSHVPTLRLIDFGCAIDMNLFKEDTQFTKVIQTDGFTCTEMLEGKPWSYQTDLFCVAGTIHVMLFGEYMQLTKAGKLWEIKNKLPRYLKKHVWTEIFNKLLNIKNIDHLPNLHQLKALIDEEVWNMESELSHNIRTLSNLVKPVIVKRTNRRGGNKSHVHSNASSIINSSNSNTLDSQPTDTQTSDITAEMQAVEVAE